MADSVPGEAETRMRRVMQVLFVVDCSGSMTGERISAVNWAARTALPALREAAADHPDTDVTARVLRFADRAEWCSAAALPLASFVWSDLAAGGETALGGALSAVAAELARAPDEAGRNLPPAIVLVSDGYATDDAEAGLAALDATPLGAAAARVAIAIGPDADLATLQAFLRDPARRPLRARDATELVGALRWPVSASLARDVEGRQVKPGPDEPPDGMLW